jgi:hypothetical protein
MSHQYNVYVKEFKSSLDSMNNDDMQVVIRADKKPADAHSRVFNAPVVNEVAFTIAGDSFERREIVLTKRSNQLTRIADTHRSYDTLQYPIMFPRGEDGYFICFNQKIPNTNAFSDKMISCMQFYAYRIMKRDISNHILNCRQLFHQYLVDMYAKIESERLLYIRLNLKKLTQRQKMLEN